MVGSRTHAEATQKAINVIIFFFIPFIFVYFICDFTASSISIYICIYYLLPSVLPLFILTDFFLWAGHCIRCSRKCDGRIITKSESKRTWGWSSRGRWWRSISTLTLRSDEVRENSQKLVAKFERGSPQIWDGCNPEQDIVYLWLPLAFARVARAVSMTTI